MVLTHAQVQHDINPVMRGILVDWLVEVAEEYKLTAESELRLSYLLFAATTTPLLLCARGSNNRGHRCLPHGRVSRF